MALVLPNSIFFHIPKSGGTFVRRTVKDLGIPATEVGDPHESLIDFSRLHPDVLNDRFVFTFIRHPLTWWQSYWAHRTVHGWSHKHAMDRECNDSDFHCYMIQVLSCEWRFHYVEICQNFITERTNFVGRQENLLKDLGSALKTAGEKFDYKSVGRLGVVNPSPSKQARYSKDVKKQVEAIHHDLISRFYPERRSLVARCTRLLEGNFRVRDKNEPVRNASDRKRGED